MVSTDPSPLGRRAATSRWPLIIGLLVAELIVAWKLWSSWRETPAELLPGLGQDATAVLVVMMVGALPLACAHMTWMMTRAPYAAVLAALLAAYSERFTGLVRHNAAVEVVPFGMFAFSVWMLAIAGGRSAPPMVAVSAGVMAAMATQLRPHLALGFAIGAVVTCAFLVILRSSRRQQLSAALFTTCLLGSLIAVALTSGQPFMTVAEGLWPRDGGKTMLAASLVVETWPQQLVAVVHLGEMAWRLAGVVAVAAIIYLRASFRVARARHQLLRWFAVVLPLFPLLTEAAGGSGRWFMVVTAVIPLVVIPAMIWRAL